MNFVTISDTMVFSAGNSLWVFPDDSHSFWARKSDWYLNFILIKASHHRAPQFAAPFLELLEQEGLGSPTIIHRPESPTMTESEHRLPTQQTVRIPFQGDMNQWTREVCAIWKNLGYPTLRVFLPQGIDPKEFQSACPSQPSEPMSTIHLVVDR